MMENKAATPILEETTEKATLTRNISLFGTSELRVEQVITTFKVVHQLNPKTKQPTKVISRHLIDKQVQPLTFSLVEVTEDELLTYRRNRVPSFVLKSNGKLYYTQIPKSLSFMSASLFGEHQCVPAGKVCKRLSAASDEDGGCEKVRNCARYIERYPWITTGFETFCTTHESFFVACCQHFEANEPRKIVREAKLSKSSWEVASAL